MTTMNRRAGTMVNVTSATLTTNATSCSTKLGAAAGATLVICVGTRCSESTVSVNLTSVLAAPYRRLLMLNRWQVYGNMFTRLASRTALRNSDAVNDSIVAIGSG